MLIYFKAHWTHMAQGDVSFVARLDTENTFIF